MSHFLLIGDAHIPRRARQVSPHIIEKITQLSSKELFEYTFFTGDLVKAPDFLQFLNLRTKNDVFTVIGNMDYYEGNKDSPIYQKLKYPFNNDISLTLGLTHGHQISPRGDHSQLEQIAIEREFNILISGHTHKEEIFLTNTGILLLNPGSVTGAWSFVASGIPSFITLVMERENQMIESTLYHYDISSEKFDESKSFFYYENKRIYSRF
ncbi:MAG: YfcE family phosphodiesterase [Candidatus Lokiarchaeota archaeon]|nr:YfcE family phosphodiesterase [Candidatus Lokiarchaeota archaeon]